MLLTVKVAAQLPYFAGTVGDGKLYGYTSLKFRPGMNRQETYTTFQYGLGNHFAVGTDLYTSTPVTEGGGGVHWGFLARCGWKVSKWFNVGGEVTPSFNLSDSFKFSYLTSALYLNGAITPDGNLFWCSNTWWIMNRGGTHIFSNYEYLGYTIHFRNGHSITPMAGAIHSWRFDQDVDIAAGFYYTIKNWSIYVWGNNFLKPNPRCIVGVEFIF